MSRNGPGHKSFTRRTSYRRGWPRGIGALNSSPHSWIFTSVSVGSRPRSYLFTSATGRIGVHSAPKYGRKLIRYVTLHFWDRCGAASLRHRNRAATTVVVCWQKPYTVLFSWTKQTLQWFQDCIQRWLTETSLNGWRDERKYLGLEKNERLR